LTTQNLTTGGRLLLAAPGLVLESGAVTSGGGGGSVSAISILGGGGQSNANYAFSDGAYTALAQGVAALLGAVSYTAALLYANDGIGLFNLSTPDGNGNYSGSFVNNSDASTTLSWYNNFRFGNYTAAEANAATLATEVGTATVGTSGAAYQAVVAALSSGQRAAADLMVCYWGETDSLQFNWANKVLMVACIKRWMALVRAMYGKTAAQLPFLWIMPPYGGGAGQFGGPCAVRESLATVCADATQNCFWIGQTYDTVSRNEAVSGTGLASGGNTDGGHRSALDNVALFKRATLVSARAILAAQGLSAGLVPSGLGVGSGPRVASASLSGTVLTVTVAHDSGTDLVVPLLASAGVGWALMDGGNQSAPGAIILATACSRVNANTLQVTLASAPSNAHTACTLFYALPETFNTSQPDTEIGRGCAVTDNYGTVSVPAGFDLNLLIGAGWRVNMPLQFPMTVSGGVASSGILLSS
jgi:hypothetical protein